MLQTIFRFTKQWLVGPSKESPILVFTPELTRKPRKRLKALAETLKGPVVCVTPKKPKRLWFSQFQWQPLAESPAPPTKLYGTARALVNAQNVAIKTHLPEFFQNQELQIDYEPAYLLNRQQILAITGLAFLSRCMANQSFQIGQSETKSANVSEPLPVMLDGPIAPVLIREGVLKEFGISNFTAVFSPAKSMQSSEFKRGCTPLNVPTFSKPTVLLVMSAPVHYELAQAALESLESKYEIVLYFANFAQIPAEQRQKLSQRYFTVDSNALQSEERLIEGACQYFNQRLKQVRSLPISQLEQEALCAELDRLRDTIHIFNLLETLLLKIQPVAVLGCFEKNRMGVVFKTLQSRYAFKLLNFQHGIMPQTHNMDLFQFDRFFIWNPLTRNVVLKDGYGWPESLAVVGNPFWEQNAAADQAVMSAKGQKIMAWRGDSPLLGAYTQYAGDYLTHEVRENYLKALFAYLEARPQVKMLIKKHPLETDQLAEAMLAQTQLQDRVFICAGRELDLWESFQLIQLSTTICSTTLLDSLKVNVNNMQKQTQYDQDVSSDYKKAQKYVVGLYPRGNKPLLAYAFMNEIIKNNPNRLKVFRDLLSKIMN